MKISFFSDYTSTRPVEKSLDEVVDMIRSDERLAALTAAYRSMPSKGLKSRSPLFAVPCRFSDGKAADNIVSLTGLSLVDIDHVEDHSPGADGSSDTATDVKGALGLLMRRACADTHTLLCYRTVSGKGLRIIFSYEVGEGDLKEQTAFYRKVFLAGTDTTPICWAQSPTRHART